MDLTHLITFLLLLPFGASVSLPAKERCFQCKFLVETFKIGMDLTKKAHFAGGNTDWEERKLGKFATSETRFIEVLESTCKKELLPDSTEYEFIKDIKHKCHTLVEKHEELLEDWFLRKQEKESDLMNYFCLSELRSCCPSGHFGIRDGTGKCKCDHGYVGSMCSNCDAHFYPVYQNDTAIECAEEGCKDIDECLETGKCTKDKEFCVNSIGSYHCECEDGYRRNKDQECEIDIEAQKSSNNTNEENEKESAAVPSVDSETIGAAHSEL
uniref:EGF-like domain-containing protein n=1 Tax=Panagrolaimus sp. PS1159 TaxID=55785 RepID=A0AC35G2W4_9BILA